MKKTLIALAAVAVSSAAMAQVTISGNLTMGYTKDQTKDGVKTSGYGTDTSQINFNASEDLGNGLKATAQLRIDQLMEQNASSETIRGNGVTLGLMGGFGSVVMTSVEGGDYLPIDGLTTNANGTDADRITYTLPTFVPGLTLAVTAQDDVGVIGETRGTAGVTTYAAAFSQGPISVDGLMADFRSHASIKSRTGLRASYDFGVAKVTYGMLKQDNISTADQTQTGLTVAAPLGPVTVAAAMADSKLVGSAKRKGTSLSVTYALSKRTSINYYNESHDTADGTGTTKVKESHLLLSHSF